MMLAYGLNARLSLDRIGPLSLGSFNPASLFGAYDTGILIDPSSAGSLFQDDGGTTPVASAGQSVGLALDISGRSNHATQATSAKRPTYAIDGTGRPYLQFDGTDDFLKTVSFAWGTGDVTVIAAFRREGGSSPRQFAGFGNHTSGAGSWGMITQPIDAEGYSFSRRDSSVLALPSTLTYPQVETAVLSVVSRFSVSEYRMRRNGVAEASSSPSTSASVFGTWPMTVGCRLGGSAFFSGRLYGLIAISRALSDSELSRAERWAAHKCGVTI